MKSTFARVVAACLAGITGLHSANFVIAEQPAGSPDIVLILADDLGHGDVGCHNPNPIFRTPH